MGFFPDKSFDLVHDVVVIEVVHTAHEGMAEIVNRAVNILVLHDITSIGGVGRCSTCAGFSIQREEWANLKSISIAPLAAGAYGLTRLGNLTG